MCFVIFVLLCVMISYMNASSFSVWLQTASSGSIHFQFGRGGD